MHIQKVMADLYRSEINASFSGFYDGGWTVKLGDEMNGFVAEHTFDFDKINSAASWLANEAAIRYPDSKFAKEFREGAAEEPMSEEDGFIVEAALDCGFTMINDDGDVFGATQAQVIALAKRGKDYGMRLALRKGGNA